MTRFAIYARYSSDRQSERSIDDQVRLCRERVARDGGTVVDVFADYAISGASAVNRPAFRALMEAARAGRVDAVIAEALDRLSRDQEDVAGAFKRLTHAGVRLVTLAEGEVNELHVGLKGTMNALFLKDLAMKIRRGQRGRVEAGLCAGGTTYGYQVVRELRPDGELVRGKRQIDESQAAIVRRIFEEYAAGESPRAIAARLNAEGVPPPRGTRWNASTINGSHARANGILYNELYVGRRAYNRQRMVKDPDTGRRVTRLNPRSEWVVVDVPELRIVDDGLWQQAQAIKQRLARAGFRLAPRARHMLAGLLACGVCGGPMVSRGSGRYGCSARTESGTCTNGQTITRERIESRVLDGLRRHMLDPEAVAEFVREYHAEWHRRRAERGKRRRGLERERAGLVAKIDNIVTAIADGRDDEQMRDRMMEMAARRKAIDAELGAMVAPPEVVTMHPQSAEIYRRKVDALQEALNADGETRRAAIAVLRGLVTRIVLHPKGRGAWEVEMHGALPGIVNFARTGTTPERLELGVLVVAEEGLEPPTRGL